MKNETFTKPIEIWINEDCLVAHLPLIPLLRHTKPPEIRPEIEFWNLIRNKLIGVIEVRYFKELEQAGSLVATPHTLKDYFFDHKFDSVYQFNRKVLESGRTLITFTGGIEYKPEPGEIVFATSTYQSKTETSISTPNWLYDFKSQVSPIPKPSVATVGFVGETQYPGRINKLLSYLPIPEAMIQWLACSLFANRSLNLPMRMVIARLVRQKVIKEVKNASNLKLSLIERKGGFFTLPEAERKRARAEYIQNIQNNAYTLCMRGDENCSYRLYEVMSAGRLPVLIDTNMRLPDLGSLKWEEFCVIVPFSDLHQIGERIQAFHDNLSDEAFKEACMKSRAAFEYLSPENFIFKALKEQLPSLAV